MRRLFRRLLWKGPYLRFVVDIDAILMGAVYIAGSVFLVLAVAYLWKALS